MKRQVVTYASGEPIFLQGAKTDFVYHLLEGRVSLWNRKEKSMELEPIHVLGLEGCYERNMTYPYSIWAETDVRLIAYEAEQIPEHFLSAPQLGRLTLESLVRQLQRQRKLLQRQSRADEGLVFAGDIQTFGPGEYVIKEDEKTTEIYRIVSASKGLEVSKRGKVLAVIREPGEFFGEMAAVSKSPRTASVISLGESVLEVYSKDVLSRALEEYPEMAMRIISGLSERLAEANQLLAGENRG